MTAAVSACIVRRMSTDQAVHVLRDAEKRLRDLVIEAAATGDYDAVARINEWARKLGVFVGETSKAGGPEQERERRPADSGGRSTVSDKGRHTRARKRRKRPSAAPGYPRFARDGDELIKIGWSKRKNAEYCHRAPLRIVDLLVERVARHGSGALFTAEDIFPLSDPKDGHEVPSYQAYLCLAWLREEGLVEKQGKQGYRAAAQDGLTAAARERWEQLFHAR